MSLAERAAFLDPNSSMYQCELGFQNLQLHKPSEAERHFKNATRLNENDLLGIIGSLRVALMQQKKDIFEQVAALEELHSLQDMPMVVD